MSATRATSAEPPLSAAGVTAWKQLLRSRARLVAELDAELRSRHGTGLDDFDVLVQLVEAPEARLRMCELAAAVVLSPSGLSRRVDRLERTGLVTRARSERDAREVEAALTPAGERLLSKLRKTHRRGVKERFEDRFSRAELEQIAELLGRLGADSDRR